MVRPVGFKTAQAMALIWMFASEGAQSGPHADGLIDGPAEDDILSWARRNSRVPLY
jgi:hypothetical protein